MARKTTSGKWTKAVEQTLLTALSEGATVKQACFIAGVSRSAVGYHRKIDPAFKEAYGHAMDDGADVLEAEAQRRGYQGTNKPVFYQGEIVGHIREYSDTLLTLLLRARNPEKFRERHHVEGNVGGPSSISMSAEEANRKITLTLEGAGLTADMIAPLLARALPGGAHGTS